MAAARSAETVGADAAAAVQAARSANGIATLILPSDSSWSNGGVSVNPLPIAPPSPVTPAAIAAAARVLRSGEPAALWMTGAALEMDSLAVAHDTNRFAQAQQHTEAACVLFSDSI